MAAVAALTLTAGAQVADVPPVDQPGPYRWTETESTAPSDLGWDERLPRSDLELAAADMEADPADLEGIFRYRFLGEHRGSRAGFSISFSNDTDCDGFVEVVIGAPVFSRDARLENRETGAVYLVSMADVEAADAADGTPDGVIDLRLVAAQPRSWKLTSDGLDYVGTSVASGGDVNGDGCSELLIGARAAGNYFNGAAYLVSASDLPAADAADGAADGVVDIRRIADQPDSWELTGEARRDNAGRTVIFAGDVNADGRSDLLIGAFAYGEDDRGAAYLLSGAALASADAADGVADGRIALASVAAQPDSWKFVGENAKDFAGARLAAANLDSDGRMDLLVAAYVQFYADALDERGAVYLIAASDLRAMDGADGQSDGVIDLGNVAGGRASWKLVGDIEDQHIGAYGVAAGDVDGDGVDNVVISNRERPRHGHSGEVFVISVSGLASADAVDGARDGVATLDRVLEQDGSFKLVREGSGNLEISSDGDIDGDGLDDLLVGDNHFNEGSRCLPGGGIRGNGAVYLLSGASLRGADASDGTEDSVIDLDRVSSQDGSWQTIGGPTDRLGTTVAAGDLDGDGNDDLMLASWHDHTPAGSCGWRFGPGFVFVMSSAHLMAADAVDGATDGRVHLDALRIEVEPLVVRQVTQVEDSVVVMHVSRPLRTTVLDFDSLTESFYSHYRDEFDYLVFISNLPAVAWNQHHNYSGSHRSVSNTVRGTGRGVRSTGGMLKSIIHFPYRDAILYGPSLHEFMHSWANYGIPTVEGAHWGFSSANGQLGGFDMANLVDLGNGRYSAGSFGTFANGGNSLPYSPIELYFAGLIPPEEVPPLWVGKDGRWLNESADHESGNPIFAASDVETWSVARIVAANGARVPDWRSSQKSFRAAVVLITDDSFPATRTALGELREDLRAFSHPGPEGDDSRYNFWEATGGRATVKTDDLRVNQSPAAAGILPDRLLTLPGTLDVDVSAAFVDPDGDALTYAVSSSAPSVVTVSAAGARVTLTAVSAGTATIRVTAMDRGGPSAAQAFTVLVWTGAARGFTDDPIRPGVTPVRAIHFTELRARIDSLREAAGLGRFRWTDPALRAGATPVRLVHLTELRSALAAAYTAAGRSVPRWTDAAPVAGTTPIRMVHLMELRAAVVELE